MGNASLDTKTLVVAGAGTGKTTMLLDMAAACCSSRNVLYLTYTNANAHEFESALIERIGCIPASITVMTWFSFLLVHGVRPFPAPGFKHRIDQLFFDQGRPRQIADVNRGDEDYYCPAPGIVYRSRLSDLAALCDQWWDGAVIDRICSIYDVILVDEGQDFAGYDYDLLLSLMNYSGAMIIVGDPRQQTYRTNHEQINSGYKTVFDFFNEKSSYPLDTTSLRTTYRCSQDVIDLANRLFPELPTVVASENSFLSTRGSVIKLKKAGFSTWAQTRSGSFTILRYSSRVKIPEGYRAMNMGESKGLTLGDVVIFPTNDMRKWIEGETVELKDETRAKLYVAITRASGDVIFAL